MPEKLLMPSAQQCKDMCVSCNEWTQKCVLIQKWKKSGYIEEEVGGIIQEESEGKDIRQIRKGKEKGRNDTIIIYNKKLN